MNHCMSWLTYIISKIIVLLNRLPSFDRKSGIKRNHTWIESENSQLTGGNAAPMKNSLKLSRGSKEENLPHSKPVKGAGDTGGDQQDLEMAEVSKSDTEEVGSLDQDMDEQGAYNDKTINVILFYNNNNKLSIMGFVYCVSHISHLG